MSTNTMGTSASAIASGCDRCADALIAGARFCPFCGYATNAAKPQPVTSVGNKSSGPSADTVQDSAEILLDAPNVQVPGVSRSHGSVTDLPDTAPAQVAPLLRNAVHDQEQTAAPIEAHSCPVCGAPPKTEINPQFRITMVHPKPGDSAILACDKPVVIGKGSECNLVVSGDPFVSRRHARISIADNLVFVDDLGSSNGTLLRIRRPIVAEPGDELIVGSTVFRLECT